VPFYIRTGKRLPKRVSEIAIEFNPAPLSVFGRNGGEMSPNLLILRIQPEEGISLKFVSKQPGAGMKLRPVSMDFNYGSSFGERFSIGLRDPAARRHTGRRHAVLAAGHGRSQLERCPADHGYWSATTFQLPNYPAGTWGPADADTMLARRGHTWRKP